MDKFWGYHSEWNLGSPGGWDYQRITQEIGKAVWARVRQLKPIDVDLDFDHPLLYPINGFTRMLTDSHQRLSGGNPGLIAVIAEEESLEELNQLDSSQIVRLTTDQFDIQLSYSWNF